MVRTIVCKQALLSSLKKQNINSSPTSNMQSKGSKRWSKSPPSSSDVIKEEDTKEDWEDEDATKEFVTRCSKRKCNLLFGKPEMCQMVKKGTHATYKRSRHMKHSNASRWTSSR